MMAFDGLGLGLHNSVNQTLPGGDDLFGKRFGDTSRVYFDV